MKKLLALPLLLMVFLTACGETEVQDKEVASVESADKSADTATEETKTEETDTEKKELNQLIVDNENIKATLISIEKIIDTDFDEEKIEVKFEVENKRADTIDVQAREVSADGKMIDESMLSMSTEIAAGKKADAVMTIQNYEGDLPAVENDLEMLLHVFSWDNMDWEESHQVNVEFK
jgi:ABC-type glycerol-3-phosphate transport system substrate-binding protein